MAGVLTAISSIESLRLQCRAERRESSQLHEREASNNTSSVDFRTQMLEDVLIQLSDQQLLLGLVVLICAFAEYYRSALGGNDNLWHAADVACFSMFSHAATLLALQAFFREHRRLATMKVSLMVVVFALWAVIGYYMLHPSGPYHKTMPVVRFWHGAIYIEFIGVSWAYTMTCVPVFISDEAIAIGRAISSNNNSGLIESLKLWEDKCLSSSRRWYNPLQRPPSVVFKILSSFTKGPKWKTSVLRIAFSILFSRCCIEIILLILWLFTFSALVFSFVTNKNRRVWDFGQSLSLATAFLPLQSLPSTIASKFQFKLSWIGH